jgi:uncharacterized cupredoxin-like copper-binding protein
MTRRRLVTTFALVALAAAVLTACGDDDDDSSTAATAPGATAARTIDVEMVDIAFHPTTLDVKSGETVRFIFHNKGATQHDAFIGDTAAQAEHDREMQIATSDSHPSGPGTTSGHDMTTTMHDMAPMMTAGITVEPGQTGELTYTFDQPGMLEIGCHEPGHYQAGMKISVTVA